MKEKSRSTAFNVINTLVTKFTLLFGGFIISIILARLLGSEGLGVIAAVFVFPTLIISLADMGIRQSTAYFIGKEKFKLSDVISSVAFLWLITSVISMILVLAYYYWGVDGKYPWIILLIALASVPIKLIEQYGKGIMQGRNQISVINLSQILRLLSNFLGVIIFVWIFKLGIIGAAIVQFIIASTVAIYYLIKIIRYGGIKFKPIKPIPKLLFFRGFSFAIVLFIINLNYKIDIIMLDSMVEPAEIGVYTVGTNIAELLWEIPSAIGMVLFSKSAITKNQINSVERSTTILRMVMPVMIVVSLLFASIAPLIIKIVYGAEFTEAGNILRLLLPGICIITISKILHPDLAGRGYPLYALKVFLTTFVVNVLLNLLLIPEFGIYGAAISSTISYSVAGLWFGFVYAKKEGLNIKDVLLIKKNDLLLLLSHLKLRLNKH